MFERNIMKLTKMKTRNFMFLVIIILMTSAIIWLINVPSPHLRSIVSKTQLHIKNINSRLKALDPNDDGNDSSENDRDNLEIDSTYLELLGFVKNPKLFEENLHNKNANKLNNNAVNIEYENTDSKKNSNFNNQMVVNIKNQRFPPLVTAFMHFGDKEKALIESKVQFFQNDLIIIYDLDLSSSEQLKIKKLCNSSSCLLKTFKGDKYPNHLVDPKMKAYKPIIIQDVLNEYESLIWIEPPNILTSNNIDNFLKKAKVNGILAWPFSQPVTQLTHPSMFKYFQAKPNDFYFVHILDTTKFILYNNKQIHLSLMLPWVKCALKKDCIAPAGSKFNGCDFTRKPLFLYSGCHRYEMSSFSIIAALLFDFDQTKYSMIKSNNKTNITSNDYKLSFIENYYDNSQMATELLEKSNNRLQTMS